MGRGPGRYPSWLDIVPRAEPGGGSGGQPAWYGRPARSPRTGRPVEAPAWSERCTSRRPPVVFERVELDGRSHALGAAGRGGAGGHRIAREDHSRLTMQLQYGGGSGARCWNGCSATIERSRRGCCADPPATVPAADRYGAHWNGSGTEMRVQAPAVSRVELCGVDEQGRGGGPTWHHGSGGWWSAETDRLRPGGPVRFPGPRTAAQPQLVAARPGGLGRRLGPSTGRASTSPDPGGTRVRPCPLVVVVDPVFDWTGTGRPKSPRRTRSSTRPTSGR